MFLNYIKSIYYLIKALFIHKLRFAAFGLRSRIISPLRIEGANSIFIGNNVYVGYKCWLAANPLTNLNYSKLSIGNGTTIGHFCHIYSTHSISIGNNVLLADKVYISDNIHGYENIHVPIKQQPIVQKKSVIIGDGSWLGENVCVIGASIGMNCVIGANSVVTHDIPDYCIAVGSPAQIIKKFDTHSQKWISV